MSTQFSLKQRADLTHKYNAQSGRHGWLRLTPAYSLKVVENIFSKYDVRGRVLDPFCGTGTTALCAARLGHVAVTTDINPFLVWLSSIKTKRYELKEISSTRAAVDKLMGKANSLWQPSPPPPIHRIDRWWSEDNLAFLCELKGRIDSLEIDKKIKSLLLIAFCRTLINLSNACFNHQSMSFKSENMKNLLQDEQWSIFLSSINYVLVGCQEDIGHEPNVLLHDARLLDTCGEEGFDLVITSPPYANRMSYIRELRPYMYWLGYLNTAKEAGEFDWQAIGGTWGIATSRLNRWCASKAYTNSHMSEVIEAIYQAKEKHSDTLARYVHKYCEDIHKHILSISRVLNIGAKIHYIVGNSTFYGNLVRVEDIYTDIMDKVGFHDIQSVPIRKRNSKKELIEFDISAIWKG